METLLSMTSKRAGEWFKGLQPRDFLSLHLNKTTSEAQNIATFFIFQVTQVNLRHFFA